jgi:hypothetical protein
MDEWIFNPTKHDVLQNVIHVLHCTHGFYLLKDTNIVEENSMQLQAK